MIVQLHAELCMHACVNVLLRYVMTMHEEVVQINRKFKIHPRQQNSVTSYTNVRAVESACI